MIVYTWTWQMSIAPISVWEALPHSLEKSDSRTNEDFSVPLATQKGLNLPCYKKCQISRFLEANLLLNFAGMSKKPCWAIIYRFWDNSFEEIFWEALDSEREKGVLCGEGLTPPSAQRGDPMKMTMGCSQSVSSRMLTVSNMVLEGTWSPWSNGK